MNTIHAHPIATAILLLMTGLAWRFVTTLYRQRRLLKDLVS